MGRLPANTLVLNRSFLEVPKHVTGLDAEATLSAALRLNRAEDWGALLKHPYVVVLGEAGTGKSTEFHQRAKLLTEEGKFAFFVELSELAANGLTQSLDVDDDARLDEWRESQDGAVFFLDSLDEAKLQNRTLEQALRRLRRDLKDEWDRVRLVVSCRASDWMAEADRNELGAVAPERGAEVRIVQLAPLNTEQVEQLAQAAGVTDVAAFMGAVSDNYAHVFIERPLDVQWLGAYWARHQRIGSLRELIEDNVREKLRERPGRPSSLSLTTAEAGIKTLAGVAMINNAWAFALPDNVLDAHRAAGAIDAQELLPDWSADDVSELLRRPVFDVATYGRVRLHHRSVQEYLAARWIADLVSSGMAHARVLELLLREEGGEQVIPAHLGPVAAWLALWGEQLRRALIREAPSLLIGNGDPSGFTDEERRQILRSYARSYQDLDRRRQFDNFDQASLKRFSAPSLSKEIETLLKEQDTPEELVSVLLRIIEKGRISACADISLAMALDPELPATVRSCAISAAVSSGTDSHRSKLIGLLDSVQEWEQDVADAFLRALYPERLGVDGLMRVLVATKPRRRNLFTALQYFLEFDLPKIGSTELRLELLERLFRVVWVFDSESDEHVVPPAREWLVAPLSRLLAALLDDKAWSDDVALALIVFRWANEHRRDLEVRLGLDEVKQAVERHPEVKRRLFWRTVEEYRRREGTTPTRFHSLPTYNELYEINVDDHAWLAEDARSRPEVRERVLAFDALYNTRSGDLADHLVLLYRVAEKSPELLRRLGRALNPPLTPVPEALQKSYRERRAKETKWARRRAQERADLEKRIDRIREGTDFNSLWFLYNSAGRGLTSFGDATVAALDERYGVEIAEAAVAGWRAFWRRYDAPMPHEREARNLTSSRVIIGLVGLSLDFAGGLDAAGLSSEEARLAARYASCELNSFPTWLAPLVEAHSGVVTAALCPAVVADMMHADDGTPGNNVLAKLLRADDVVRAALAPCVAEQLRVEDPPMVSALAYAIDVVLSDETNPLNELAELAHERSERAVSDPARFATWWEAWLEVDAGGALDFLEDAVGGNSSEEACELVLQICHWIDKRTQYATRPLAARDRPEVLKRLIPLVYEHIKPEDDTQHEGAYWVGPRDNAEHVRSLLMTWLAEVPQVEAVQALRELADDPRLIEIRDVLLHRADQRLAANATASESEVVTLLTELCKKHGTDMSSHLDELREEERMEAFDVGIVTMKEEEYDALLDKFGKTEHLRGAKRDYDVAAVETSRGKCRVAITRCAQQGNSSAQSAATEMLSDISPRFLLVVGIAGGVPTVDFCLGDVVVSDYIQDLTLEDTGAGPGDERYNALGGRLHPSAGRIVERLRAVERSATGWNSAESIGCDRPGLNGEHTTDDVGWNKSIDEALDRHARRNSPIGTARTVASSDRLIKAPELLQKWRKVLKAVAAVEMESAGAYAPCQRNNVPFMAIRGISDIVGWKRDEAWTLYACHTAAAYTRMLVGAGVFVLGDSAQS